MGITYMLNGWQHEPWLVQIRDLGWQMLRVSVLYESSIPPLEMLATARIVGPPLVIVAGGDQVRALAEGLNGAHCELWNEPNGSIDRQFAPWEYAALVPGFVSACHDVGAVPWIGAVSNTDPEAQRWLRAMIESLPSGLADYGVTTHWYPHGRDRCTPHPGFESRQQETDALMAIVGDRRFAVSEFGFHTAEQRKTSRLPSWWPGNKFRWTDTEVAHMVRDEYAWWERSGAAFCCLYQIMDGPHDTREERFGIIRCAPDGTLTEFKPVASVPSTP